MDKNTKACGTGPTNRDLPKPTSFYKKKRSIQTFTPQGSMCEADG